MAKPDNLAGAPADDPPASSLRRLVGNASWYGIGSVVVGVVGIALDPILSYRLTAAQFGLLGLCASVVGMLSALYTAGLDSAANRLWFEHERDADRRRRAVGTCMTFVLAWVAACCLAQELLGPWVYRRWLGDVDYVPYGRWVAAALALGALGAVPRSLWAAREDVKRLVALRVGSQLAGAATLAALLLWTDLGPVAVLASEALVPALMLVPLLRLGFREFRPAWHLDELRPALAFGLPMVVHLTSHWVLNAADRLVIEQLVGRDGVGLYSVAYKASVAALITVNLSLNGAYVPQFMRAQPDPQQRPFVARAVTTLVGTSAVCATALFALGPAVVRLLYADSVAGAADLLQPLALGAVAHAVYLVSVNGLFYAKRTQVLPLLTLAAGAVNVALCYAWIPRFGLAGAAWATTASYVVLAVLVTATVRSVVDIPWPLQRLGHLGLVLAGACAVAVASGRWLTPRQELAANAAVLVAVPAVLWLTGFVGAAERQWLRAKFGRRSLDLAPTLDKAKRPHRDDPPDPP